MTSHFAHRGRLTNRTHEAYTAYGAAPQITSQRLRFHLLYLSEVLPIGLTVRHIPASRAPAPRNVPREEIQILTYAGKIFMSGLVSLERTPTTLETIAGDEAYTQWDNGDFVSDGDSWRFFTGLGSIRFFKSYRGVEYDFVGELDPIVEAEEIAEYLQREFDGLSTIV